MANPNVNTESILCHICCKYVYDNQNSIFCDLCYTWLHAKCTKLTKKNLTSLSLSSDTWFCQKCRITVFPFSTISNSQLLSLTYNSNLSLGRISRPKTTLTLISCSIGCTSNYISKCSICQKKVKPNQSSIFCISCHHKVHIKCSHLSSDEILNFNSKNSKWSCYNCISNCFPFKDVNNFSQFTFNSNFNCSCLKSLSLNNIELQSLPILDLLSSISSDFDTNPDNEIPFEPDFKYYSLHDFHKLIKLNTNTTIKTISIIHSNIRSLNHNFESLSELLVSLDFNFSIIALSETWNPKSKTHLFFPPKLEGYHDFEYLSGETSNSGCGFYIKNELLYVRRNDLSKLYFSDECEFQALWIEIVNERKHNILICVIYVHPKLKNPKILLDYLDETLSTVNKENKTIIFTGDTNLDLLQIDSKQHVHDYLHLLLSYFMIPQITQPTRFSDHGNPTLIDHFFL